MINQDWTGDDLKAWRDYMGFTQEQAAEALGMSRRGIQTMEATGKIERRTILACLWLQAEREKANDQLRVGIADLLDAHLRALRPQDAARVSTVMIPDVDDKGESIWRALKLK